VKDELVRTQYVIMKILKTKKATNHMKSITLKEIAENERRNKPNTLYKHIRLLVDKGLVGQGAKAERANAYYLSEKGLELLRNYDGMEERTDGNEY
jgi:predicted transcriptional regulator